MGKPDLESFGGRGLSASLQRNANKHPVSWMLFCIGERVTNKEGRSIMKR